VGRGGPGPIAPEGGGGRRPGCIEVHPGARQRGAGAVARPRGRGTLEGVPPLHRREVLRAGAVAAAGAAAGGGLVLGVAPLGAEAAESPDSGGARVRRHPVLGRTGLRVPDIGFGGSRLAGDEALVRRALDRGVTYFDTAEDYTGGESERTLGRALAGDRQRVVLGSKVKCGAHERRDSLMRRLEASLRRLRTDWVDLYFNHAVNDVDRIANPEWAEFTERAAEQGKIRWRGLSGHGGRLIECLDHALDHDLVDVILVAFNFGQDPAFYQRFTRSFDFVAVQPDLPRVLAKAKAKDVGVLAMKTLRGAKLNDMRPYEAGGATFAQAAFRWVLSHDDVDALIVTMRQPEEVEEYLGASGWTRPRAGDAALLVGYERAFGDTQCRYACAACAGACPAGVPVAEVLRSRMYAADYGDPALGREQYAALGGGASPCLACDGSPCAGACPHGLPIAELTRDAARRLG